MTRTTIDYQRLGVQAGRSILRAVMPLTGNGGLKIELNNQERRALGRALVERRARLIESAEDTTQPRATQRVGLLELSAIASVLRKLRRLGSDRPGGAIGRGRSPRAHPGVL
jgi:hypothetical protein